MTLHHAHESPQHPEGKQDLGRLFSRREFLVLYEHKLADGVVFRPSGTVIRVICFEHDLTLRNTYRNTLRNFSNGCDAMVILVPDERARAAARRLLQRRFPRTIWTRVGILTHATCRRQLTRSSALTSATETLNRIED